MKVCAKTSTVPAALLAACVVLACSSAPAKTIRMGLMMDVKNHQSRATFETSKDHPGEEWLYLTQAHDDIEFEMRLNMSGLSSSRKGVVFASTRKIQYEAPPMRVHAEGKLSYSEAESN